MNKQEILEELVRMRDTTKVSDRGSDYDHAFNLGHRFALNKVLLLIDHQLDEDEPQKVIAQIAEKWHEDIGPVLWWDFPVEEPPYCGTPLDDDFPKYKTHFTELHIPDDVEQEPKYRVLFPIVKEKSGSKFSYLTENGMQCYSDFFESIPQLTESEIRAIDERYWAFAVPVEQMEV